MKKKVISVFLSLAMMATLLVGCGNESADSKASSQSAASNTSSESKGESGSSDVSTGSESKYADFITVDVFDTYANYQGIQGGWFGKIIKDKFNMELNIIAPNVAGGGDTLYQTRSAAGNLGDLIIYQLKGGTLQDLVTAGLVTDMSPYMGNAEYLDSYKKAIETTNSNLVSESGVWAIPSEVTTQSATDMINTVSLNSGIYIRWDLYKQLGYPEMNTFEDLLSVMKDMQDIAGESDSGKKVYAFSLFKDWDGALIQAGQQIPADYGWGMDSFVLQKADDSEEPIDFLAEGSPYIRGLHFYYQANQMGLLDPESTTQNYDTLYKKYEDGGVLFSPWPWLGGSAYNTTKHTSEGKGFQTASIKDLCIREWGCYENGNPEGGIMVGSSAQDPQRMVDFINWLYSPEGIQLSQFQMVDEMIDLSNGEPALTEMGLAAFLDGDVTMPEQYGGGSYKEGKCELVYKVVSASEINPLTGYSYTREKWTNYVEAISNDVDKDWQEHMGAKNAAEYWKAHNMMCVSPGTDYAFPADSTDIATMRSQITEITKEYSWKAIYASSEAEFSSIIEEMRTLANGLGYQDVIAVDMANAQDYKAARGH